MILPLLSRGINNTKHSLPCQWNILTIAGCSKYLTRNGIRASSSGSRHGVSVCKDHRFIWTKYSLNFRIKLQNI